MRTPRSTTALFLLSLILPLSIYAGLARRLIGAGVGYQMDEALYVESAVFFLRGGDTPPFVHEPAAAITIRGRRWPLMIIPYVGAAKDYVALPLFAAFGVRPEVARYAAVLVGGLGIAGLVALLGRRVGPVPGLVVGLLLSIHPSYLDFTVFDNGGVSVWMAAMGLLALAVTNHLARHSAGSAFLLGLAAGLGVWARANVAWLVVSMAAAALLVWKRRALPPLRHAAAMLVGGVLGVLPLIAYEIGSGFGTLRFIAAARQELSGGVLLQRLHGLADLMVADGEQRQIWSGPPLPSWQLVLGVGLLGLVLVGHLVPALDTAVAPWRRFFAAAATLLTWILLTSHLNISQHHLVAVLPLGLAAIVLLGVEIARRFRPAAPPLAAAAAGLCVLSLSWDVRIDRGLRRTGGTWNFSSAIDDAGRHLEANPVAPDRLKILNWGFQNNLYVRSAGRVYGTELFWGATRTASSRGTDWDSEIRDGGAFLLFVTPTGPPALTAAGEGFSEALARYGGRYRERVFPNRRGAPHVRLVEIPPAP